MGCHLFRATKAGQTTQITYKYNVDGIRVEEATTVDGQTTTKTYLIDSSNFTGYAQVLEEFVNGNLAKTYTLGADVVTQADALHGALTLLYDGHGSTRALLDAVAAVVQRYAYRAYGEQLGGQGLTAAIDSAITGLLYSGEKTDWLGRQDLRARIYEIATGRFTQGDDPRFGRSTDPQSLHKYLYTHGNPANGVDPSGQSRLVETLVSVGLVTVLGGLGFWAGYSKTHRLMGGVWGGIAGAELGAIIALNVFGGQHALILKTVVLDVLSVGVAYLDRIQAGLAAGQSPDQFLRWDDDMWYESFKALAIAHSVALMQVAGDAIGEHLIAKRFSGRRGDAMVAAVNAALGESLVNYMDGTWKDDPWAAARKVAANALTTFVTKMLLSGPLAVDWPDSTQDMVSETSGFVAARIVDIVEDLRKMWGPAPTAATGIAGAN